MDATDSGTIARRLEPFHAMIYFAPEAEERYVVAGLKPGRMGYFASRSAAMGAVSGPVVAATFYNFNPALVTRAVPAAWALASPESLVAARFEAVDAALTRMLGAEALAAPAVADAAGLARTAAEACAGEGRPIAAAQLGVAWPQAPHLVLWHALSILREHRGDGHITQLVDAELSGLEALITATASGTGFVPAFAQGSRGWSDEQWADGVAWLTDRGLLGPELTLTADGAALRARIEADTDRLGAAPWAALGAAGAARIAEVVGPLVKGLLAAGCFPKGVFARG